MANGSGKSGTCKTLVEFSKALDVPKSSVSRWLRRIDWPFPRRAPWSKKIVPEVLRWAADTLEKGRPAKDASKATTTQQLRDEKLKQEIRKLRANADQAETALARERGELLLAADVEREWVSVGVVVRNALENLPSQAVPLALTHGMPHESAGKFQSQVEELIAGILRHLSRDSEPEESQVGTEEVLSRPLPA